MPLNSPLNPKNESIEENRRVYPGIAALLKRCVENGVENRPHHMRYIFIKHGIREDIGLTIMWELINDGIFNLTNEWILEKGEYWDTKLDWWNK